MVILEYHNIASPTEQPVYSDFAIGLLFACECTIPGHDQPFGSKENGFSTKKAARTNAAREAVEYLISAGLLNEDGSIKSRKKAKPGSTVKFESNALRVEKSATYSQRVSGNYFIAFNYPFPFPSIISSLHRLLPHPWPHRPNLPIQRLLHRQPQHAHRLRHFPPSIRSTAQDRRSTQCVWEEERQGGMCETDLAGAEGAG